MKTLFRKQSRIGFWGMFLRGMIIVLILTAIGAALLRNVGSEMIFSSANNRIHANSLELVEKTTALETDTEQGLSQAQKDSTIGWYLRIHTYYYSPPAITPTESGMEPSANIALSAILDEQGNVLYSSRETLSMLVRFSEETNDKDFLLCDADLMGQAQYQQLRDAWRSMIVGSPIRMEMQQRSVGMLVKSAYVDREQGLFVPHECTVQLSEYSGTILQEESFVFEADLPETFTLLEFQTELDAYPRAMMSGFYGTAPEVFDDRMTQWLADHTTAEGFALNNYEYTDEEMDSPMVREYTKATKLQLGGQSCTLLMLYRVDLRTHDVKAAYFAIVGIAFGIMTLCTLVICALRATRKKAEYAMEDYQRTLTNELAHDLKTPLAAISGYAENLRENVHSEKREYYADAILQRTQSMDTTISDILQLSKDEQSGAGQKEPLELVSMMRERLMQEQTQLQQRGITVQYSGEMQITANRRMLLRAIDNLADNALRYTPDGGCITVSGEKRRFQIENDADTAAIENAAKLMEPFVKGSSARNTGRGSGLGLSIVKQTAELNGLRLTIHAGGGKFTATLK